MPLPIKNLSINRLLQRLFMVALLLFITLGFFSILILILLPTMVSTDWGQRLIQKKASVAIGRPLQFKQLDWSWTQGVTLDHLVIPDLPEFSQAPLVSIKRVRFKPDIKKLLHRKAAATLFISRMDANIVTDKTGVHNFEMLTGNKKKSPMPKEKKNAEKKEEDKPYALPSFLTDIAFQIHLEKATLFYENHAISETYGINNLDVNLSTASLKKESVNLVLEAESHVNGHAMPRSKVSASVMHLFDEEGVFRSERIAGVLDATLPGITAQMNADFSIPKANADLHIEMGAVMEAVAPLVPDFPPETAINGILNCTLTTDVNPNQPMAFNLFFSGTDLSISGEPVDGKIIGPGTIAVNTDGIVDLQTERVELKTADIRFLDNSRFQVTAILEQIKNDDRKVHLSFPEFFLDLDEITSFLVPLLPSSIHFLPAVERNAVLSIDGLTMDGTVPKGLSDLRASGLKLLLPDFAIIDESGSGQALRVSNGTVNIDSFSIQVKDLFPASANLALSLQIDELVTARENETISISGFRLEELNVAAKKIASAQDATFGFSGSFLFDHRLAIDQGNLSDLFQIDRLSHFLKGKAEILADDSIRVSLDAMDLTADNLSVKKEDFGPINTGIDIHAASREIAVKQLAPFDADVHDLKVDVRLEEALGMSLFATILHLPDPHIEMNATLVSDLKALGNMLPPKLLQGASGSGNLNLALSVIGRQPTHREKKALEKRAIEDNLSFIDQLNLGVDVTEGALRLSLPENNHLEIRSINALPLVNYELDGDTGKGKLSSTITTGNIIRSQGGTPAAPVSGFFSLTADHEYSTAIAMRQSLSVLPAGVKETADISINGLDRILEKTQGPELTDLLTTIGADISAAITIPECRKLTGLGLFGLSDIDISGPLKAGVQFRLSPNRSVGGTLTMNIKEMGLHVPETISIHKLDANVDFDKFFDIFLPNQPTSSSEAPDLSSRVIAIGNQVKQFSKDTLIQRHIQKIHERTNPDPALSFEKAEVMAAPFPLAVDDSVMMLNIDKGLPNLDFFQFHLLGGTLNGSVTLANSKNSKQQGLTVNTALTFSGIDTAQIFPDAFPEAGQVETDISGALYADLPATDRIQTLLENTTMTVEFTKIGARALERLLYSLDPYESNEAIVSQRRLLKTGTPKNFRMELKDGFLTLRGKVSVKGIDVSMPTIRRLNIAQIHGMDRFEGNLADLAPVIAILQKLAAQKIVVNKTENTISFE